MTVINRPSLAIGPALILCLTAFLAACSTVDGAFPSLERRPYEIDGPNVEPESALPAAPTELPPELAEKVKALTTRHDTANARYAKDLPGVQATASRAAGSAAGSESWVNAHLELSRLDNARSDSVAVVREMDALIAEQIEDQRFIPLLTTAQKPVADDVAAQNEEINRLSQLIGE